MSSEAETSFRPMIRCNVVDCLGVLLRYAFRVLRIWDWSIIRKIIVILNKHQLITSDTLKIFYILVWFFLIKKKPILSDHIERFRGHLISPEGVSVCSGCKGGPYRHGKPLTTQLSCRNAWFLCLVACIFCSPEPSFSEKPLILVVPQPLKKVNSVLRILGFFH